MPWHQRKAFKDADKPSSAPHDQRVFDALDRNRSSWIETRQRSCPGQSQTIGIDTQDNSIGNWRAYLSQASQDTRLKAARHFDNGVPVETERYGCFGLGSMRF